MDNKETEQPLRGFHHDGYDYFVKNAEKIRYSCIKKCCPAKLYVGPNQLITVHVPHTCIKSEHECIEKKLLRQKLKQNAATPYAGTAKKIFDETCLQNKNIAASGSFPQFERIIQLEKKKAKTDNGLRAKYGSIKVLDEHLKKFPFLLEYKEKDNEMKIKSYLLESSSLTNHMIFYDENLMGEFQDECDIYVDGTFKICPDIDGVQQVLTIMGKKHNTVVPIAWVLMSRRTTKAYNAVWQHLKEKFSAFSPKKFSCDFEKALIRSLRESFPGIKISGCLFHFCQAVIRKAKSKDYQLYMKDKKGEIIKNNHEILKKILVLPLLPPDKIKEGFTLINDIVQEKFSDNPNVLVKWKKFLLYVSNEWLKKVKPEVFSVFNQVDRTNNFLESYHRTLNKYIRTKPSVDNFIYNILKIKEKSILDSERAKNNIRPTIRAKLNTRQRDKQIRNTWLELQATPPWSVKKFIDELSGYTVSFTIDVIGQTLERIDSTADICNSNDEIVDSDIEDDELDFADFSFDETAKKIENPAASTLSNTEEVDVVDTTDKSADEKNRPSVANRNRKRKTSIKTNSKNKEEKKVIKKKNMISKKGNLKQKIER